MNKNIIHIADLFTFLFLAITLIFMGTAIVFFILCFINYDFEYPKPDKVKQFIEDNTNCLSDYSEDEVLNNIIKNISNDYIKIAINNDQETSKHSGFLNNCYICIVITLALMVIDFVLVLQ